jgi:FkbM family methyltransferase
MKGLLRPFGRTLFGRLMPRIEYPVILGPLRGSKFILGSMAGDGGGASVYFNLIEREQTDSMKNEVRDGDVFFDIGANVGYYTILASRMVGPHGHVVSCEPLVRNLAFLQRHVTRNRASNVTILPFACSDSEGISAFSAGSNVATGQLTSGNSNSSILVPTIRIDTIVQRSERRPDVIKIDVEGAELDVLKGARQTLVEAKPVIYLSTHSNELRSACLLLLEGENYHVQPLIEDNECHEFLAKKKS